MNGKSIQLTELDESAVDKQLSTNPWPFLQTAHRQKEIFQVDISGMEDHERLEKKETCFVVWFGYEKGLIPFSQTGLQRQDWMFNMLGSKVPVLITDLEVDQKQVLLSMTKAKEQLAKNTRKSLKIDEKRTGVVQRITKTRVIVDIGGIDAILKREEISWAFVDHPGDLVKLGQTIEVKVIEVEQEQGAVYVSKKALEKDPWLTRTKLLSLHQPYVAQVTGSTSNAVFLKLFEGVFAMAPYRSELSKGTRVAVKILSIRTDSRRINCQIIRVID